MSGQGLSSGYIETSALCFNGLAELGWLSSSWALLPMLCLSASKPLFACRDFPAVSSFVSRPSLTAALCVTAGLGVDVAYTEIDIRMRTPSNAQKLQQLADVYGRVARSCMNVKRCVGMTIWGTFQGEGDALLWNSNYQKKSAYNSFLQGIQAPVTPTNA
ncbi:hypothetical protein V8F06_014751 [Rhypophila decipiens]